MEKKKYVKNLRYMKNVRNAKNVWNVRNVLHIFYHFCIKRFCKILQVLTGLNLQNLAKTFYRKKKYVKNLRYMKNVRNAKNVWNVRNVLHIFYHFCIKCFCKILQVLTGLNLQNLKKRLIEKNIYM